MSSESVRVKIFGTEYPIKSGDADIDTLKRVAFYVDSKIMELQGHIASRDNTKIAVLTALNIAGELFETKAKYEAEVRKVRECEEKIKAINEKISKAEKKAD